MILATLVLLLFLFSTQNQVPQIIIISPFSRDSNHNKIVPRNFPSVEKTGLKLLIFRLISSKKRIT